MPVAKVDNKANEKGTTKTRRLKVTQRLSASLPAPIVIVVGDLVPSWFKEQKVEKAE